MVTVEYWNIDICGWGKAKKTQEIFEAQGRIKKQTQPTWWQV